jgi:hypothetical protein
MKIDLTNFLLSLATAMAALATSELCPVEVGDQLWILQAREAAAGAGKGGGADVVSVLRVYGGPQPEGLRRIEQVSIQCMTTGASGARALSRASQLYGTLYQADEESGEESPRHAWAFDGKRIGADGSVAEDLASEGGAGNVGEGRGWVVDLAQPQSPPGLVGVDPQGRQNIVFNFDVVFHAKEIA